ncbi:hypothetical protein V6N13_068496 [Hibiscus sabdariffa]
MFCFNRMTNGMSRIETTGPALAEISAGIQISAERLAVLLSDTLLMLGYSEKYAGENEIPFSDSSSLPWAENLGWYSTLAYSES